MQPPMQFRLSGLRRMQRTPSSIGNRASSSVHQADRSPPPSHAVLLKRAARKTNRRRTPTATVTTTTTSSPYPGAMRALVQFRPSSLRRMQRTPSLIVRQTSSRVHQPDRSSPTKSRRTTQTSCAHNQPTAYSNCDGNRDDDLLILPGSHANLGAIPVIQPPTNATHSVFQHLASVAYRPPKRP